MSISAIILTKNEAENIEACIKSLSFCKEIIVIDDNSTDNTLKIAEELGASVYERNLEGDIAAQKNFAMEKAVSEWLLFIDADERVSKKLEQEIKDSLRGKPWAFAFSFQRIDYLWGKWLRHGEIGAFKSIRLMKKGSGHWKRSVHEYFDTEGEVEYMQNPILHYPHQNLSKFIDKINIWSTMHAKANLKEGKKSTLVKVVVWPVGHFLNNYFMRLGFMDGMHGFVVAGMMSFHSYLSWSKQWLLQRKSHRN